VKVLKLILLVFCVLLSSTGRPQNGLTPLDSALVACYPFSGNANDLSGNNMNGTVNGAYLTSDRFGNPNSAYFFSGNTATTNILIPGFSTLLNGTGVSISFWTNKSTYETRAAFLMDPDDIGNRLCACVYYGNNVSNSEVYWDCGDIFASGRMWYTNCPVPANNMWDHWVFVASQTGGYMKAYQNGVLTYTQAGASPFYASPARDLSIGGGYDVYNGYLWFQGKLDDIKIYKRALLQGDVTALYNSASTCSVCAGVAAPSPAGASNTFCAGNTVTLSAAGSPTLNWYTTISASVSAGSGTSFSVPGYSVAGTYTYYVRASNSCTMSAATAIIFTVNPNPGVVAFAASQFICKGQSTTLTATGATSYNWKPGNATSQTINVSPVSNTAYSVTGTASGCSGTAAVSIMVLPLPALKVTSFPNVLCRGEMAMLVVSGASSYTWNNGIQSPSLSVTPAVTGTYAVAGTDSLTGCRNSSSLTLLVQECSALSDPALIRPEILVYPNPGTGRYVLVSEQPGEVCILNSLGEIVYRQMHDGRSVISIETVKTGIYSLNFSGAQRTCSVKLIKQ
jgi:hypothetical protein